MNAQHTASDHTMTIDGYRWGTLDAFLDRIDEQGGIPDIGQFHPTVLKGLKALVKSGELVAYRGYWDSLSSAYGMGPLKTIYASPEFANARAEMDAGIKARFQ